MTCVPQPVQSLRRFRKRHPRLLVLLVGVLIPVSLFGVLAAGVLRRHTFSFDEPVLLFMHGNACVPCSQVMLVSSVIGSGLWITIVDALVCLALIAWRRWRLALFWGLSVGGAALLNFAAKSWFGRMRPALWQPLAPETTFSFPSAHAMQTMALVLASAVLSWPTRWRGWVLFVGATFVILVGLSRVYLGVHYPSDVLAGWLVSLAWVSAMTLVLHRQPNGQQRSVDAG